MKKQPHPTAGFSLIQMSMVIAVASIIMVSILPGGQAGSDAEKEHITKQRMVEIEKAMQGFMAANLRRPCPADASIAVSSINYGVEADNPGECTGGSIVANFSDPTDGFTTMAVAGMVPTKSLNLPDEYALDGFGRRLMYIVDKRATLAASIDPSSEVRSCSDMTNLGMKGDVKIVTNHDDTTIRDYVMWSLISYGKSGHGAYPMQGSASRINASAGVTTRFTDEALLNAFVDDGFASNFQGKLSNKEPDAGTYDNIVWYSKDTKNTCCVGKACSAGFNMAVDSSSTDNIAGVNIAKGDINGDGIDDMVVTNNVASPPIVYVVWGTKTGWPVSHMINKDNLTATPPVGGFSIVASAAYTQFGRSVKVADVSGDGFDDIILGGRMITVIFGGPTSNFTAQINAISGLNGVNGLRISGYTNLTMAAGAITVGDINNDGIKDIIFAENVTSNTLWVVYGTSNAGWATREVSGNWSVASLAPADGFKIVGDSTYTMANTLFSLASADFNNDGRDDLLVGGSSANGNFGYGYLFLTPIAASGATPSVHTVMTTVPAPSLFEDTSGSFNLGLSIAAADMNNDGISDVILGSTSRVFIQPGSGSWSASYTLPASGTLTFDIATNRPSWISNPTQTVLTVADINHDGSKDLLLGINTSSAPSACSKGSSNNVGSIYAIMQPRTGWASSSNLFQTASSGCNASEINVTSLGGSVGSVCATMPDSCAFRIDGTAAGDYAYIPIVADINRDSRNDIIVAAPGYDGIFAVRGKKYLGWDPVVDLATIDFTVVASEGEDGGTTGGTTGGTGLGTGDDDNGGKEEEGK